MPDLHDSEFRKLFQQAGHAKPERDLTQRIMARVAVSRIAEPTAVPPLIGKKGWIWVAVAASLVVAAAIMTSATITPASVVPYLGSISAFLSKSNFIEGPLPQWLIGGSLLALFFSLLIQRIERGVRI